MAAADESSAHAAENPRREAVRGQEGFFHVARDHDGRWSLFAPDGRAFFCRAVHGVRGPTPAADSGLPPDSAARLRAWGFNTLGCGGDPAARDDGLKFFATVDFCRAGPVLVAPELRLPDVFDPEWPRHASERTEAVCPALGTSSDLVGWVSDDQLAWAQVSRAGRPTLLQLCLSLEPSFAAYHAAWEFVLALHGGKLETVARAWGVALANKEVVRELARAEIGIGTRGYLRDEARWTQEFAQRYFAVTSAAIRAVDPNHLMLGCRFRTAVGAHVLAGCAYPAVDVALPHWSELPPAGTQAAQRSTTPVIAGDFSWVDAEFFSASATGRGRRVTSVERMLQRGRVALERIAQHPLVVGYAWPQWLDEPGEQPPFARGLVHPNGAEAREHTELLADFNARVENLRRTSAKLLSP